MRKTSKKAETKLQQVIFTHPNKKMFSRPSISKLELGEYYKWIASRMLPELAERPLMLARFPNGNKSRGFYQKHHEGRPPYPLVKIKEDNGQKENYAYIKDSDDLLELVQLNTVEFHTWGARIDKIEKPDRMIFDLDPDKNVKIETIKKTAYSLKALLEDLKLKSYIRISGGKGLHIVVPLKPIHGWDTVKEFSRAIADFEEQRNPNTTINPLKTARKGKIFIDYIRNSRTATSIANYSVRGRVGAPIAVPITWKELKNIEKFNYINLGNVKSELSKLEKNPWKDIYKKTQVLPHKI